MLLTPSPSFNRQIFSGNGLHLFKNILHNHILVCPPSDDFRKLIVARVSFNACATSYHKQYFPFLSFSYHEEPDNQFLRPFIQITIKYINKALFRDQEIDDRTILQTLSEFKYLNTSTNQTEGLPLTTCIALCCMGYN